jgi:hypothetical protein
MRYRIVSTPNGGRMVCPIAPIADHHNPHKQGETYPSRAAAELALRFEGGGDPPKVG